MRSFFDEANLRTNLWATTKRIEDEKIGLIPIKSIILENAAAVELAWNEDNTKYDMASTRLSYIDATSYGDNDGLHYVDDGVDVELYRETFRMIFEHMHQEQHYNMMMGIKKGGR